MAISPSDVAINLRTHLARRGLSQSELSRRSGIPQPEIFRFLRVQTKRPDIAKLQKLADALGVSVDELTASQSTAAKIELVHGRNLPRAFISSTLQDLAEHRRIALDVCLRADFLPVLFEDISAGVSLDSHITESLNTADLMIVIVGGRYGILKDEAKRLSWTEWEVLEAQKRGVPVLAFVASQDHALSLSQGSQSGRQFEDLMAFRSRLMNGRVVQVFNSPEELERRLSEALSAWKVRHEDKSGIQTVEPLNEPSGIPAPRAFYAKPDYIGRHTFVGRTAQLEVLTDWAKPTDTTSILLFEAIGGSGKSMLTWEWTTKHADEARAGHEPWAGRFWYSFYEKGAIMRDFCLHALHYMTQQPMETLEKKPMADLRTALLAQLHARPWLLILDGLERVLVAYHRIDAAEVRDEEINRPTDKILDRDPCDTIRPEDAELLRALTAAKPSKILISSRLIPRVLLNPSGLPLPGVRPLVLPGLDDADAERLFCEVCGIRGTSADIRYYLKTFCDNHPLVIGVLAGLINSPGPHRGHFDAWAAAPEYGAKLNLARLDLIQSRNHILRAAMDALEAPSRQLLSTLALLTDAVDYDTVAAFNPHLPPEPEEVDVPTPPEKHWRWDRRTDDEKAELREQYEAAFAKRKAYEQAMQTWRDSAVVREAPRKLGETLQDLERRGLVQYDANTRRYDLHPVVRGVAAGGMKDEDKERYGQRVVDHFNTQSHPPYDKARTMEDVASGLHVVRTLLNLGHHQQAVDVYRGDLADALAFNLEAHVETLALLHPFFLTGWDCLPSHVTSDDGSYLASKAALALHSMGENSLALHPMAASLLRDLREEEWTNVLALLYNTVYCLRSQNRTASVRRIESLTSELVKWSPNESLDLIVTLTQAGRSLTNKTLQMLIPDWRGWTVDPLLSDGDEPQFEKIRQTDLKAGFEHLLENACMDHEHRSLRIAHQLRGSCMLAQGEWALAAASFDTAVTMAREVRLVDAASETGLALAKHHLGQFTGDAARSEAERLAGLRDPAHGTLALLWLALGDPEQAKHHALAAYRWAWADGEPYVHRYELTKTTELLQQMNVPVPVLPPYDPAKDEPFPWEADVRAAIEKLKAEKLKKE